MILKMIVKRAVICIFCLLVIQCLSGQKPIIDSLAVANWPYLTNDPVISTDGNYFVYTIDNQPVSNRTLVIQSTNNEWKKEFVGASFCTITNGNKQAIFQSEDTLKLLSLGSSITNVIKSIDNYKQPAVNKGKWIAYQPKDLVNAVMLRNLLTGKEQRFDSVADYSFDDTGNVLLLKTSIIKNDNKTESLQWVDLRNNRITRFWTATRGDQRITRYNFDKTGMQLAFLVEDRDKNTLENSIWYYSPDMDKAVVKVPNQSSGIVKGLTIANDAPGFSGNGKYITFRLIPIKDGREIDRNSSKLDIWSFRDSVLQSTQLLAGQPPLFLVR